MVRYLAREEMEKCVCMKDVIGAVKRAFSLMEKGRIETPLRTVMRAESGSMLFMPAYCPEMGIAVMKNVNVFPGNAEKGLPTTPAEIMLIDATDGRMLAVMDGTYVTRLRTGAASGAAFDVLARKHCVKGALIGTGGQAEAQLEAMLAVRSLEKVSIYSPNRKKREAFAERMRKKAGSQGALLECAQSADACVEDADLIVTVTTAAEPVFDGRHVKKGATVSCVGTYEPDRHEIDPMLMARADKIYCDSCEAALSESGDLLIPIHRGILSRSDITGGLGEVLNGEKPGRETDDEIIVFETVGIAAQDLMTAGMIYDRASRAD